MAVVCAKFIRNYIFRTSETSFELQFYLELVEVFMIANFLEGEHNVVEAVQWLVRGQSFEHFLKIKNVSKK